MNLNALNFAPVAPVAVVAKPATIKVAVLKGNTIAVRLNSTAFEKLGQPGVLAVESASYGDDNFLKLSRAPHGAQGWPVATRLAPKGDRERPSAQINVHAHPFEPGVTHAPQEVEATWCDDDGVIALPDWPAMLSSIDSED